ncbi:MAG: hypothetical protein TEF_18080 [Rhizobiales bacterium NRL2]|nr:MAG: hypothetical protein TEF_18080 [Rhizobiales bacterium NRL2]
MAVAGGLLLWIAAIPVLDRLIGLDDTEQGAVENLQLVILSAAGALWLLAAARPRPEFAETFRALALGVAAACIAGLGREVTWGEIWDWPADAVLAAHLVSWPAAAALILAAFYRWLCREPSRLEGLRRAFASMEFEFLIIGVGCFLAADLLFEKELLQLHHDKVLEEAIELFAYALWLAGALHATLRGRRRGRRGSAAAR